MRAPSLLVQCWLGLMPHDKDSHAGVSIASERDLHLPSPAVEIVPSKVRLPTFELISLPVWVLSLVYV